MRLSQYKDLVAKPVIVVIDEFGKSLDYMAHHNIRGDLFIVQQLAEMNSFTYGSVSTRPS